MHTERAAGVAALSVRRTSAGDSPTVPVAVVSPPAAGSECPAGPGRVHRLAVIDTDDELIAVSLAWLREGLVAGDLTVACVVPAVAEHVRGQLPGVEVSETTRASPREPDALAGQLTLLARAAVEGRRLRILGHVVERAPRAWDERVRGEAAHQHAFADQLVSSLCVYDRRVTPPPVLAIVRLAHPEVLIDSRPRVNAAYVPPAQLVASLPWPVEPLQAYPPVFAVDDAPSLPELRHQLAAALRGRAGDRDAEQDFHLAASEIAANAFRHGGRPVSARLWASPDRLVCAIYDGGTSYSGVLSGYRPAHGDDLSRGGMGMWLARKLCDHVDLQTTAAGFTVRLTSAVRR